MKAPFGAAVLAVAGVLLAGCGGGNVESTDGPYPAGPLDHVSGTLVVQADSSLKDLIDGASDAVQRAHPALRIDRRYSAEASSSGQPGVVVSVSRQGIEQLHAAGRLGSPLVLAQQPLTLVVAPHNPGHVATLTDLHRPGVSVAVCASDAPCGQAAATLLKRADVTPAHVERVSDAEAALAAVTAGRVDAALVWDSDVRGASGRSSAAGGVRAVSLSASPQTNIRLLGFGSRPVLVATAPTGNTAGAKALVEELQGPDGQRLLRTEGFR